MKNLIKKASNKVNTLALRAKCALENKKAEGYVDSGVKILNAKSWHNQL